MLKSLSFRLLVEKLPKHPTYKSLTPEQKKQLKQVDITVYK